jgi:hypothetical protein
LSVALQNRNEDEDDAGHALKSNGLLRLEASQYRVPSLASRLMEARRGWCTLYHRRGCVELKLKTDGSIDRLHQILLS